VVRVDHGTEESLYAHLSAVLVEHGDPVAAGQQIGTTGNTGNSTGPHLHFGAFRPSGPDLGHSFDPYGWNADWRGESDRPLPPDDDPWFVHARQRSERRLLPGARDNAACPAACGSPIVVDDLDPGFALGCARPPCGYWQPIAAGFRNHAYTTFPNGRTSDYQARWRAPAPPGTYLVEVYVPMSSQVATAHAARYRVGHREVVVDQHREGNVWVDIGLYTFQGAPEVTLTDAVYLRNNYEYTGRCQTVGADAVRFTPMCGSERHAIPVIGETEGQ
jgi:hypothetical protein